MRIRAPIFTLLTGLSLVLPLTARADGFDYTWLEGGYFRQHLDTPSHLDAFTGEYVAGGYGLGEHLDLLADYSHASNSINSCSTYSQINGVPLGGTYTVCGNNSVSIRDYSLGLGGHFGLTSSLDLTGSLEYVHNGSSAAGGFSVTPTPPPNPYGKYCIVASGQVFCFAINTLGGIDSSGERLRGGVRWAATPWLELDGQLGYLRLGSQPLLGSYSALFADGAARFAFNEYWAVGLDWTYYDKNGKYTAISEYRLGLRYGF